jgi:hypothetical protein
MPRTDIDYSNTVFYKIYCKDINFHGVYVGHTTNFVQRKHSHKRACNKSSDQCHNLKVYKTIRERGGWDNWNMEIIGFKNCKDHSEACAVEQEYFNSYEASLNSILAKKSTIERLPIAKEKLNLYCEICKIKCSCTKSFERHQKTKKHLSSVKAQENPEISMKFNCKKCDYSCNKKRDFNKHLNTLKHKKATMTTEQPPLHICSYCNKQYMDRTGLWRHNKKCKKIHLPQAHTNNDSNRLINVIEKHNEDTSELKKLLIEQSQQIQAQQKQIQELIPRLQQITNINTK